MVHRSLYYDPGKMETPSESEPWTGTPRTLNLIPSSLWVGVVSFGLELQEKGFFSLLSVFQVWGPCHERERWTTRRDYEYLPGEYLLWSREYSLGFLDGTGRRYTLVSIFRDSLFSLTRSGLRLRRPRNENSKGRGS